MTTHGRTRDVAHHHPNVHRVHGCWVWECRCGGASLRSTRRTRTWRQAIIEALIHSETLAP